MSNQVPQDRDAASDPDNESHANVDRRDAMLKMAKYTAPAMLVMLASTANAVTSGTPT